MIRLWNLCRDHDGAPHRNNFDTPPLKGLRLEPFRFHREPCRKQSGCRRSVNFAFPSAITAKTQVRGDTCRLTH